MAGEFILSGLFLIIEIRLTSMPGATTSLFIS
jgi:hypothetical protein